MRRHSKHLLRPGSRSPPHPRHKPSRLRSLIVKFDMSRSRSLLNLNLIMLAFAPPMGRAHVESYIRGDALHCHVTPVTVARLLAVCDAFLYGATAMMSYALHDFTSSPLVGVIGINIAFLMHESHKQNVCLQPFKRNSPTKLGVRHW